MKVLCIYDDDDYLEANPVDDLDGHEVTVASTYKEAAELINQEVLGFDVVLAEWRIPCSPTDKRMIPTALLIKDAEENLIRGFGTFVPKHFESQFSISDGMFVQVSDGQCRTIDDKKDWGKLLDLILMEYEKS